MDDTTCELRGNRRKTRGALVVLNAAAPFAGGLVGWGGGEWPLSIALLLAVTAGFATLTTP